MADHPRSCAVTGRPIPAPSKPGRPQTTCCEDAKRLGHCLSYAETLLGRLQAPGGPGFSRAASAAFRRRLRELHDLAYPTDADPAWSQAEP